MHENNCRCSSGFDTQLLTQFAARYYGESIRRIHLNLQPLTGGLVCPAIARVTVFRRDRSGGERRSSFVVKSLSGHQRRELAVYKSLLSKNGRRLAPKMLGAESTGPDSCYLYLEFIRRRHAWPWSQTDAARMVLAQLAAVHASPHAALAPVLAGWDYEAELRESAHSTAAIFEQTANRENVAPLKPFLLPVRRMAAALPEVRRQLLSWHGTAVLHGDAHPGNAMIRGDESRQEAVLLDWARVRLGSPLEDVSSWLHSLGHWEPEARRRHDTLVRAYLEARGLPSQFDPTLRELTWFASACNALAGAVRYYLWVLSDPAQQAGHAEAAVAVRGWLRVIRRADLCWRN